MATLKPGDIEYYLRMRDDASKVIQAYQKNVKVAASDIDSLMETASRAVSRHSKEVGGLTKYARESQREQRLQNVLFRQGQEAIGAASLALALFSQTGGRSSESLRKVSDAANDGFLAFQGVGNVASFIPGPLGQIIPVAAGVAVAFSRMSSEVRINFQELNKTRDQIDEILIKLGTLAAASQFGRLSADIILAKSELQRLQGVEVDYEESVKSFAKGGTWVYRAVGTIEEIEAARKKVEELNLSQKQATDQWTKSAAAIKLQIIDIQVELGKMPAAAKLPVLEQQLVEAAEKLVKLKEAGASDFEIAEAGLTFAKAEKDLLDFKKKIADENARSAAFVFNIGFGFDMDGARFAADQAIKQFQDSTKGAFGQGADPEAESRRAQEAKAATDQAMALAGIRAASFTTETQRELQEVTDWYNQTVVLAHGNEELITQARAVAAERRKQIELRSFQQSFRQYSQLAQQAMSVIMGFQRNNSQAELNRISRERDARLEAIDKQLESESLTEQQREQLRDKRASLEREYDKQERDAKKKAFAAEKTAAVIGSIMQTAMAVVEALPNIPLAIIVGALGAAQTAVIAGQPTPEFHQGGAAFVNAPTSQEVFVKLRGQEDLVVRTPEQREAGGQASVTVNVYINAPIDDVEWVRQAVQKGLDQSGLRVDQYLVSRNANDRTISAT